MSNSLAESKRRLRTELRERLASLTEQERKAEDVSIYDKVIHLPEYQSAKTVFIYISVGNEVDTRRLLQHAVAVGKRVGVPRCVAPGEMQVHSCSGLEELRPAGFGLLEPAENAAPIALNEIDFAAVPCLACDAKGHRLGQGGGYYDRALAEKSYPTAALCREVALMPDVPVEPWDIRVNYIITGRNILKIT